MKVSAFPLFNFIWKAPNQCFPRTYNKFRFSYVSTVFVERELKTLKNNKTAGLDNLPSRLLKDSSSVISRPIAYIINSSLETATVPNLCGNSKIVPIHKSGPTYKEENFRQISILPILSKVMERAVQQQFFEYLETNKLLSKVQFGYRKNKSTQSASTFLTDSIRKSLDNGELVGSVFVDLTKAFDTISLDILLNKLNIYGVQENEYEWFASYLFRRSQKVLIENNLSDEFFLNSGVPQGSILGPLLFILFINDFPGCIPRAKVILYADDAIIYYSNKDLDIVQDTLNIELQNIAKYFRNNELIINLKKGKTEAILFGTARKCNKKEINVLYQDQAVNTVKSYKYLGCLLDSTLSMNQHFDITYKKACGRLKLLSKMRAYLTSKAALRIYKAMIVPLMTFNATINLNFTNTQKHRLSSIDRRAKQIIGGEEDLKSIEAVIKKDACIFVKKCINNKL